jgi:hypothetical protein
VGIWSLGVPRKLLILVVKPILHGHVGGRRGPSGSLRRSSTHTGEDGEDDERDRQEKIARKQADNEEAVTLDG